MNPGVFLIVRSFVTSLPSAFRIVSSSQSAITSVTVTSVAVALETALPTVYPSGSLLTATVAP